MAEPLTLLLQGDHYTMGLQHGRQARAVRPMIAQAMAARLEQIEQDKPDDRFHALYRETRGLLEERDRPLVEMVRGQAEALDLGFESLMRYSLYSYLHVDLKTRQRAPEEGCSTWAAAGAATAGGQPILVKNRDYRLEHLDLQVVIEARPERGYRYLCSGSAGSPGVFCAGINQVGLAVADTHVPSTDLGPGLPDFSLMMHILEEQESVASAIDYLRVVKRMGRNNLIMADARGNLAVVELGHRSYGLRQARDGVLVNTNNFLTPELRDSYVDTSAPSQRGNSFQRYQRISAGLEAAWGAIDVPYAQRLMGTHGDGLDAVCRHPRGESESATISCSVFLPAERAMHFCHGLPCQGRYEAYGLEIPT